MKSKIEITIDEEGMEVNGTLGEEAMYREATVYAGLYSCLCEILQEPEFMGLIIETGAKICDEAEKEDEGPVH